MRVRDRDVRRVFAAPFDPRHWRALAGIVATFERPLGALSRYLSNSDRPYPWQPRLRTPLGPVTVTLNDRHDLLTVNEVFCRRDYGSGKHRTVVDIGANVGIATLFFLTRSPEAHVWAFEPDPANIERLRHNLRGFTGRYTLVEAAVTADDTGTVRFVPAGRYGYLAASSEPGIDVPAVSIACALREIQEEAGPIDLVKIDTEGTEPQLVAAIPGELPIGEVRYEDAGGQVRTVT